MPDARCTRSLACEWLVKHTSVVTTGRQDHPAFPHAMVLTAYSALSPATNSSCHRRLRIDGISAPGWADFASADLTPATGARTTRLRALDCSRTKARPATTLARRRRRVHRIPPYVRDDRETPLSRAGMRRACRDDLPDGESGIFFKKGLDRANHLVSVG